MALYGIYGRHEISMCPINRKESAIYTNKFFNTDFSEILPKYKINKIVAQYHSGFEHTFLWVFDAEYGHGIQEFAMDYGMTEWNELKICSTSRIQRFCCSFNEKMEHTRRFYFLELLSYPNVI